MEVQVALVLVNIGKAVNCTRGAVNLGGASSRGHVALLDFGGPVQREGTKVGGLLRGDVVAAGASNVAASVCGLTAVAGSAPWDCFHLVRRQTEPESPMKPDIEHNRSHICFFVGAYRILFSADIARKIFIYHLSRPQ